jgi:uncharacterized protein YfiM (DUF2279 family)
MAAMLSMDSLRAGEKIQTLDEYFKSFASGEKAGSTNEDSWFSIDKGYHVIGSMMCTTFVGQFSMYGLETSRQQSRYIAAGTTFALGVTKELNDARKPGNRFSWKDLAADCAGILIGVLILGID